MELRIGVTVLYRRCFAIGVTSLFDDELVLSWRRIKQWCNYCSKRNYVVALGVNIVNVCKAIV